MCRQARLLLGEYMLIVRDAKHVGKMLVQRLNTDLVRTLGQPRGQPKVESATLGCGVLADDTSPHGQLVVGSSMRVFAPQLLLPRILPYSIVVRFRVSFSGSTTRVES